MRGFSVKGFSLAMGILAFCSGCEGGGGGEGSSSDSGSSGSVPPTSCVPYLDSAPVSSWTIDIDGSFYDVAVNVDTVELAQFRNIQSGCSISRYEIALVAGNEYVVYTDDVKPSTVGSWRQIYTSSNEQLFNNANLASLSYASVCFRAYSNLNEESNWYCSAKAVPVSGGGGTPTDTTAPTTPATLTATKPYWSTSSQTMTMRWAYASDTESGVAKYWGRISNSSMVQIGSDFAITGYSGSYSYNASLLTAGGTYYFSVAAENGVGLIGGFKSVSFYKPFQVTAYLKYNLYSGSGCIYPSLRNCTSANKVMYDTQLVDLRSTRYPTCTFTNKGASVYELDCQSSQSCHVTTYGGTCGGSPSNQYHGTCGAVYGVYVDTATSCNPWNPTLSAP